VHEDNEPEKENEKEREREREGENSLKLKDRSCDGSERKLMLGARRDKMGQD